MRPARCRSIVGGQRSMIGDTSVIFETGMPLPLQSISARNAVSKAAHSLAWLVMRK